MRAMLSRAKMLQNSFANALACRNNVTKITGYILVAITIQIGEFHTGFWILLFTVAIPIDSQE